MRVEHELAPLLGLLADRQQPYLRGRHAEDLLGEHRAHVGELQEMLGASVGVGAGVDEDARASLRRDHCGDARAGGRPEAGGCAGARPRAWRRCSPPRRPLLRPRRRRPAPRGRVRSRASPSRTRPRTRPLRSPRMSRRARGPCVSSDGGPNRIGSISAEAASAAPATISSGATVSTQRVDRDPDHGDETLRSFDAKRLDVPAPVRLAVRADPMGPLRLLAGRAHLEVRDGDPVLRAALVAPRPRRFPLGDGHERLPSIARG